MPSRSPRLTIGMPVYNGEAHIERAIDSLLAQSFEDFVLLISDNASTDRTPQICEGYAKADARVVHVRQPRNIGAPANFGFVVARAETPFFMWAASDDFWLPDFIAQNVAVLDEHPDVVCSVSRVAFDGLDPRVGKRSGTFALMGSPAANLVHYLRDPACNSRFYGVHRSHVVRAAYSSDEHYLASDWVVMARMLSAGRHFEVPEILMQRSSGGASSDIDAVILASSVSWVSRFLFPMWPMTRRVLRDPLIPRSAAHGLPLLFILARRNFNWFRNHSPSLIRRAWRQRTLGSGSGRMKRPPASR